MFDRIRGWETKAVNRLFRFEGEKDKTWFAYFTRTCRIPRKTWVKMVLLILSEVIAESTWRAMGWVCDERPNAVINTLKHVFGWGSTDWWKSTQASEMKDDPYNHTRWKHKWRWHNRGCVWGKLATEWAGKDDWMNKRSSCPELEDKKRFVTFAFDSVEHSTLHRTKAVKKKEVDDKAPRVLGPADQTIHIREEEPTVQVCGDSTMASMLWNRSTEKKLVIFPKTLNPCWKKKIAQPISKIDDNVKHVFREHNREADHFANLGAAGERKINVDKSNNTERWKAARGFWDRSSKNNGRSGCGINIKGVDKDKWITIGKIAVPLGIGTAMAAEVMGAYFGACSNLENERGQEKLNEFDQNVAEAGESEDRCREHSAFGLT